VVADLLADPAYEWVDVPAELVREALTRWLARFRDQRFSLTDAVSFEVMRRARIRAAFAFDSDFVRAGFELLSTSGR
jgi:predicted nucleic acid-binding protein